MDLTPQASTLMGPPMHSSPDMDFNGNIIGSFGDITHGQHAPIANGLSASAVTSSQQPKVVQTAFIHKLYKYVT